MKHTSTHHLFDYWNRQRGEHSAPARSEIDPGAIRHALGDTFMLSADFIDGIRFRLAGTRVCALFGREIKGEGFNALWSEASRAQIADLAIAVVNEASCVVAGVNGRTEKGAETELELLLLPLGHDGRTRVRAIGTLAPLVRPYWLGEEAVVELELRTLRHIHKPASPSRNLEAARASAYGMAFWSTVAGAKSGRAAAQTNATLTIGSYAH